MIAYMCTSSRVVVKGNNYISGIEITGNGGDALAHIYNGESSLGEKRHTIAAKSGTTSAIVFLFPEEYDKGIYLECTTAYDVVTFHLG